MKHLIFVNFGIIWLCLIQIYKTKNKNQQKGDFNPLGLVGQGKRAS